MKVLITFFSVSGNTEKIANAISEELKAKKHKVDIRKIKEINVDTLFNYELIFLGSACHSTDLAKPVKEFLGKISSSPPFKIAGFITHATADPFGQWTANCYKTFLHTCVEKKIVLSGYFSCMGTPSPPIQEFIKGNIITDDTAWNSYIEEAKKHPDEEELRQAKMFANEMVQTENDKTVLIVKNQFILQHPG